MESDGAGQPMSISGICACKWAYASAHTCVCNHVHKHREINLINVCLLLLSCYVVIDFVVCSFVERAVSLFNLQHFDY